MADLRGVEAGLAGGAEAKAAPPRVRAGGARGDEAKP